MILQNYKLCYRFQTSGCSNMSIFESLRYHSTRSFIHVLAVYVLSCHCIIKMKNKKITEIKLNGLGKAEGNNTYVMVIF